MLDGEFASSRSNSRISLSKLSVLDRVSLAEAAADDDISVDIEVKEAEDAIDVILGVVGEGSMAEVTVGVEASVLNTSLSSSCCSLSSDLAGDVGLESIAVDGVRIIGIVAGFVVVIADFEVEAVSKKAVLAEAIDLC